MKRISGPMTLTVINLLDLAQELAQELAWITYTDNVRED